MIFIALTLAAISQADAASAASVLEAMQTNELLYRNLDITYREELTSLIPEAKARPRSIRSSVRAYRVVTQQSKYRGTIQENCALLGGAKLDLLTDTGYDGSLTRTNLQNTVGNISDIREPTTRWNTPHRMAFQELPKDFMLSDFLAFRSSVRSLPEYKTFTVSTKLLGEESVGGIKCIKIESSWKRNNEKIAASRYIFWIASERNYLPLRAETYYPPYSDAIPLERYAVSDLRELIPGLWAPFEATLTQSSLDDLLKGVESPYSKLHTVIDEMKLDPNYSDDYFSNVPMPLDAPIYTLKGGQIIKTDFIPFKTTPSVFRKSGMQFLLCGIGLLGISLVVRKIRYNRN